MGFVKWVERADFFESLALNTNTITQDAVYVVSDTRFLLFCPVTLIWVRLATNLPSPSP